MSVKRNEVVLNTAAHLPARDAFIEHLNSATRREGWRNHEAISIWLEASFLAMRGATLRYRAGDAFEKNEAAYMKIVNRCRSPETMIDISKMLGALTLALEAEPIDFVGPIFSELAASSELGQFFTPYALSKLCAGMIIGDVAEMIRPGDRFITLQEPACGVGSMTLAACEILRERGFDLARQVHWTMIDIDYSAQAAAYIQVNLCGVSADVFHGNTLSLEMWSATSTLAAMLHPKRRREDPPAPLVPTTKPAGGKPVQLTLF